MAQEREFSFKGAAERRASQASNELNNNQPEAAVEQNPEDPTDQAEEDQENTGNEQKNAAQGDNYDSPKSYDDDDRLECSYTWYEVKCPQPGPTGETHFYWNKKTGHSTFIEPEDKYWIFDPATGGRDKTAGLQEAGSAEERREAEKPPYMGYNPAIHGSYDPNADYAKWHEQKHAEEDAARAASRLQYGNPGGVMGGYGAGGYDASGSGAGDYTSTLGFNRFTGHAQQSHLDPGRHTDAAKSGRQMNAFFDTEAAANSHDGRSLKEERRNAKFSKAEMEEMKKLRQEKKQKKRRQFYMS